MNIPKIFTNTLHTLTGETITFQNLTSGVSAYAYYWDVGDGSGIITTFHSVPVLVPATYMDVGTYSISVTSIDTEGSTYAREFTDIITVEYSYPEYDSSIIRAYGTSNIRYPYDFDDIRIKPNDWGVADNINSAFDKLNDNLEYLVGVTTKYLEPPSKFYGWLGQSDLSATDISWHLPITGIDDQYMATENIIDNIRGINDIVDIAIYDYYLYIVTKTSIYVLYSDYNATELFQSSVKTIGDPFFEIKSMAINSTGQVYVLDSAVQGIVGFDSYNNNLDYLYSWGTYGGPNTFKGFKDPVDLHVDINDHVWVADRGNSVIKKYTKSGSWLQTINDSRLANLISITTDMNGDIHALTDNYVVKFTASGSFMTTYNSVPNTHTPKRIRSGRDGFLYIVCSGSIIKVTPDGRYAGMFGDNLLGVNFNSAYHDEHRNLFVTNDNSILKYYDAIKIDSVYSEPRVDLWTMDQIYIHKNEYVQDWVYNRSFSRLWDNMDIVRRSLTGYIYESTDEQGNVKNLVSGFTPAQYELLFNTARKSDIFVGINELVTSEGINRCLKMLYDMLELFLRFVDGNL